MNTLFIIGNGFDINLGMKTRYSDFYPFYMKKNTDSVIIKNLKQNIGGNLKTWADLELTFGEYTKNIKTVEEFDELYMDIQNKLSEYLQLQEESFDTSKIKVEMLFEHLSYPERFLVKRFEDQIKSFKEKWNTNQWYVEIITLNYTETLERILQNKNVNVEIGKHHNSNIMLRSISHIHGYTDVRMILGVNDKSQIGNQSFHEKLDITETLIKENCNVAQGHTLEVTCKKKVKNANLICIFGSSLGKTDKLWWNLILKRLEEADCRLIIFDIGDGISSLRPQFQRRLERDKLKHFLEENNINAEKRKAIESKIYFAINTKIFKLN